MKTAIFFMIMGIILTSIAMVELSKGDLSGLLSLSLGIFLIIDAMVDFKNAILNG